MKVMCRFHNGWEYWDTIVDVQRSDEFEDEYYFDPYDLLYESGRYLPDNLKQTWEEIDYQFCFENGRHGEDRNELAHFYIDQHCYSEGAEAVFLDYEDKWISLYFVDSRIVPPNSRLGPVHGEFVEKTRFRNRG